MNESRVNVIQGHALKVLASLPEESVQCCVTSPPYYGLRAYGTEPQVWDGEADCAHSWDGSGCCSQCGAWLGELGLEPRLEMYVEHLVAVFRQVWRVLRPDGVLFLNLGDSYAGSRNGSNDHRPEGASISKNDAKYQGQKPSLGRVSGLSGLKPKDLIGIPWRVAFALQADGWWLRSDIVWHKTNPLPESVLDRPTRSHEYVFMLTKAARYYWDKEAVLEPANVSKQRVHPVNATMAVGNTSAGDRRVNYEKNRHIVPSRNIRDVWTLPTQAYKAAHFAVMPEGLVEPCIKAASKPGDVVLDPFAGAGTVGLVALKLQRRFLGIELNPEYVQLIYQRLSGVQALLG